MKPSTPHAKSEAPTVELYDTTLRDGTQREGLSLSANDKLRLIEAFDSFGIPYIEVGFPGSNPKDAELFARIPELQLKQALPVAFGATRRAETPAERDPGLDALLRAETPVCTLFGKSWGLHVDDVLRISRADNLRLVEDSVARLVREGRRVFFDAEHFFDGFLADADYALSVLKAAEQGGAERLILCDTNGGRLPWEVFEIVAAAGDALSTPLGIHAHNDTECAVANSLAAVRAGARQVQGTINGFGERCGNANLCSIAPALELKLGERTLPEGRLAQLRELSRRVAEVANIPHDAHLPYVGKSAFAHKGGVHVAAMRRNPLSYQHIEPEQVGNLCRVVVSELSGRGNLNAKAEEFGLEADAQAAGTVVSRIKALEAQGFAFEAAEASVALMLKREAEDYQAPFTLRDFQVTVSERQGAEALSEATVRVAIDDATEHTAGSGNGPVSALDEALRKALVRRYPELTGIHLVGYKVRILDEASATRAITRVLISHGNAEGKVWTTVGASPNIIEASLTALLDGFEYGLWRGGRPDSLPASAAP